MGKTISHWEVMEKLRDLVKPEEFTDLKVTKTCLEFIQFEAETDNRNKLQYVIDRLNHKMIKLKEFTELMHLRAAEKKSDFPTRNVWDSFFENSTDMCEMKPGERPDTVYISNLPVKWFVARDFEDDDDAKPSEKIFYQIFEKFGKIRYVDIPICDPYRKKMKAHMTGMQTFTFDETKFFEGYVQFKDYIGFSKTMDAFRNMKLMRKEADQCITVNIKVDFDRTKHLSDASIRRREIVRVRLISRMKEKEEQERKEREEKERQAQLEREREQALKDEKERRRQEREKKRKQKILAKLKINGADEITSKIAKEEKKLLKVQRKLESIRLVEELFRRIKNKRSEDPSSHKIEGGDSELSKYKSAYESEVRQQRDRLHKAIEGRVILKSLLSSGSRLRSHSSDSLSSEASNEKSSKDVNLEPPSYPYLNLGAPYPHPDWVRYTEGAYPNPYALDNCYPSGVRVPLPGYIPYPVRERRLLNDLPGPSRGSFPHFSRRGQGFRSRYRGMNRKCYPTALEKEYIKYFSKFMTDHDDRNHHRYSRSKSRSPRNRSSTRSPRRSRSLSRRRSYSPTKRWSRSSSRRRSRSYSRNRSRSSSRNRSRSVSRRKSRSSRRTRSSSRRRSRSYRKSRSRSVRRDKSRSLSNHSRHSRKSSTSRTSRKGRSRSSSSHNKSRSKRRSKKRSKSMDSLKNTTPERRKRTHSKSKSPSRELEENGKNVQELSLSPSSKE